VWPFPRKTEAPVDSGSRPAPAPVIRRDWIGLPPIERLIGAHPLTAPSDRFSNDLATHHDPSVSTEPMGHQVSAEAPAGIVLALARPTTRNDGPAMIPRPRVQRRVQSAIEESGEWDGDGAAPPATRPSPLPAAAPPSAVRELPVVAAAPVAQRLTTLSADFEPMPVETGPRRSRIEPVPDWPAASRPDAPDGPVPPPRLTLGQARRLGLGSPIKRVPDRAVQRATAESTELPLAASPPPQLSPAKGEGEPADAELSAPAPAGPTSAPRLELPLATRESGPTPRPDASPPPRKELSVDAPLQRAIEISAGLLPLNPPPRPSPARGERLDLAPLSAAATVQRMPLPDPSPAGASDISAEQEPAQEIVQTTPHPDPSPQVGREILGARTLPSAASGGVGLSASAASGGVALPASAATAVVGLSASPSRGEGVPLAPLVGARPLRPTALQRTPEAGRVDLREPIGGFVGSDPTDERADPIAQRIGFAEPLGPEPLTPSDDNRLPSSHGSFGTVPTRSLLLPELTHVSPQPRYGPTLPDSSVAVGRRLQVQMQSEPSLGRRLPVQTQSEPSLGRRLPVQTQSEPSFGRRLQVQTQSEPSLGWRLPVQTYSEPSLGRAAELPLAPVQRAAAQAAPEPFEPGGESSFDVVQGQWPDSQSPVAGSAPTRAPSPAEGPALASHTAPETDMDELAGKLYDKIRTRLKSELLVDRERAGFLTDLR